MFMTKFQIKQSHIGLGIVLSIVVLGIEIYKRVHKEKVYDFTNLHQEEGEDDDA